MSDKLLIEIEMNNGDTVEAARALIYLANELFQYSPVRIASPIEWQQTASDDYRLKWRFSEDALSSWEVSIGADLAMQISQALGNAQDALKKQKNHNLSDTLAAIRIAFTDSIKQAEPELEKLFCPV
jgi:hypothetical protein